MTFGMKAKRYRTNGWLWFWIWLLLFAPILFFPNDTEPPIGLRMFRFARGLTRSEGLENPWNSLIYLVYEGPADILIVVFWLLVTGVVAWLIQAVAVILRARRVANGAKPPNKAA